MYKSSVHYNTLIQNGSSEQLLNLRTSVSIYYVNRSDKISLIVQKHIHSLTLVYLQFCVSWSNSVNFMKTEVCSVPKMEGNGGPIIIQFWKVITQRKYYSKSGWK